MCSHRAHYWHGPPTVSATVILSTLCIRAVSVNGLDRASESKVVAIQMPGYGFEALGRSSPPFLSLPLDRTMRSDGFGDGTVRGGVSLPWNFYE